MITVGPDPFVGVGMTMALLVAAVFAVAGVMKARTPAATTSELDALGVPAARAVARVLPPVELAIAGLLVVDPRRGAIVALVVLTLFTAVLWRAVRAGTTVSCGCLGSLSAEPVSMLTVARNAVLLAMAATALAVPAPVVPDLASVLAALSMVSVAAVTGQLLSLRARIGRVWSVALAGEQASRRRRGPRR